MTTYKCACCQQVLCVLLNSMHTVLFKASQNKRRFFTTMGWCSSCLTKTWCNNNNILGSLCLLNGINMKIKSLVRPSSPCTGSNGIIEKERKENLADCPGVKSSRNRCTLLQNDSFLCLELNAISYGAVSTTVFTHFCTAWKRLFLSRPAVHSLVIWLPAGAWVWHKSPCDAVA